MRELRVGRPREEATEAGPEAGRKTKPAEPALPSAQTEDDADSESSEKHGQCVSASQMPTATRVAGFWTWKNLGRSVNAGAKGIRILAPIVGVRRKKDEEAQKDITKQNTRTLLGFRNAYVFDRLSRDLRPAWPATVLRRRPPRSCVRLDGSSHIIAQFAGSLQGGLDTDEFQFAGSDLSGGFVVSFCCV
jgi:hypothetical protein